MHIQPKFNYQPLQRTTGPTGRMYIVGQGHPLPSVTTILSSTKDLTHLNEWRNRVGEAEASRITTESSTIGTSLHKNLENYILGNKLTGSYLEKTLTQVIIKNGLLHVDEVWGTEVSLYAKDLYAGTTDLVGLHQGIPSIIDFKNSIREKNKDWIEDYFLQLTAYALAHNEMYNTDINRGVIMIVTREGKYQEFIIEGSEFLHYQCKWANKVCEYYDRFGYAK